MAQYKVFENKIEAGGNALPIIALGALKGAQRQSIIDKYNLKTEDGAWNDLQALLDSLKEVADSIGEMNLFLIGKSIIEGAAFPPMDGLENALKSIDIAYHMNHRKNGQIMFNPQTGQMIEGIGHYQLTKFDEKKKEAVMVCHTPYPSKFEEGLIVQIVRQFKPKDSIRNKVVLDESKESRRTGGETCTFLISW
jgi:hypothetical protein